MANMYQQRSGKELLKKLLSNKIVENHFDDFLNQDKDKIKQHINCSDKEIDEAFSFISDQNFSPILDNDLGIENVLPDAIVKEKEDKWLILINDRLLNKYQIYLGFLCNPEYLND